MKHKILYHSSYLQVSCGICGKRRTYKDELIEGAKDGASPFIQEECDPNMMYVYSVNNAMQLAFVKSEPSELQEAFKELMEAFNDLMKEFPDGSAR